MCLFPKLIINKKYTRNKKNNGNIPECKDERTKYVPIGCGKCIECLKQKARTWQVRLHEELKISKNGKFVTLTFSNEELAKLCSELKVTECNAVAKTAVRRFLERWRKKYKKSVKHWLITELGHEGTERIHLHGIIFTDNTEDIEKIWKYGMIWIGEYVNNKTINYIIKYVTKIDKDHKNYTPIILCSAGIGKNYLQGINAKINKYNQDNTKEFYTLPDGHKVNLPIYYRNHIYTEEQREQLWLQKLDKEKRYVRGIELSVKTDEELKMFEKVLKTQQEINKDLGYGDDSKEWSKKAYNVTITDIQKHTRMIKNAKKTIKKIHKDLQD